MKLLSILVRRVSGWMVLWLVSRLGAGMLVVSLLVLAGGGAVCLTASDQQQAAVTGSTRPAPRTYCVTSLLLLQDSARLNQHAPKCH